MEYDLHNSVLGALGFPITAIASDTTTAGVIIDSLGFESMEFFIASGTITDGTYDVILEDGDDSGLSDAAVIDPELVLGSLPQFVAADDNITERVGTITKKRYVRMSIVSTGVTTGGTLSAVAVRAHAHTRPTEGA